MEYQNSGPSGTLSAASSHDDLAMTIPLSNIQFYFFASLCFDKEDF